MNSNYLWRSKWENQWRAVVGKGEFRHAAGEAPWGNLHDKWLKCHVHLSMFRKMHNQPCTIVLCFLFLFLCGFISTEFSAPPPPFFCVKRHVFVKVIYAILQFAVHTHTHTCIYKYIHNFFLCPSDKCPAVFPVWPASSTSSGSVSLCTFSLVMLSELEISHSIRLKRSIFADKAHAEGAPSPHCSICRLRLSPCLSTQDICIFPAISFTFSPSLCTPKLALSRSSSLNYLNYIVSFFPSPTASHSAPIQLSSTNAPSNSAFIKH